MKTFFTFFSVLCTVMLFAQVPVSSYLGGNNTTVYSSNSMLGWTNASTPYDNATVYNMFYGQEDASTAGNDRSVTTFSIASGVSAGTYIPVLFELAKPFDTVIVKRIDNATTTGRRVNALYEFGSFDGGSNSLYLRTSYSATMEDLVNTRFLNIGSDNMFVNEASTENNIERIDLIFSNGITASTADLAKVGLLINERGGNDYFKAAAITSIDGAKNVTGLGTLISIAPADWGQVGPTISTVVMSKEEADAYLRPKENIGTQTISGVFISLLDLEISGNTYIRGVSLFPNDVNASNDLIGLTDVPTDTQGGSVGGLDLMAGGGFFREAGTTVILPIKFIDITGQIINDNRSKITWTVYNNNESQHKFIIERSGNGINWIKAGETIALIQNSESHTYSFIDQAPLTGKNYYRVKYLESGIRSVYSEIVYLNLKKEKDKVKIMYNRGASFVWINSGQYEGEFTARIVNLKGQLVHQKRYIQGRYSVKQFDVGSITDLFFIMQVYQDSKLIAIQKISR